MTLQCEAQLNAISRIDEINRFMLVDSTGGFIKITKHMNKHYGPLRISSCYNLLFIQFNDGFICNTGP